MVKENGVAISKLNELEFVKGEIVANVWMTKRLVRISPKTGEVLGWIDLAGLLDPKDAIGTDVLNGIAYDAKGDRLFVTGKLWPKLFEIKLVPRLSDAAEDARSSRGARQAREVDYFVFSTPYSPSFVTMSSAEVFGLTSLSMPRILPSLPM